MQGGENLAQINLHAFSDGEEQKISKEIFALLEGFGEVPNLPDVVESFDLLEDMLESSESTSRGGSISVSKAVSICKAIVGSRTNVQRGWNELFESLSTDGSVDRNALIIILLMLSSGELEEKLKILFDMVSTETVDSSRSFRRKPEKRADRESLEKAGQLALTCLVMMNLSVENFNGKEYRLALFDPQTIMLVGKNHLDRAISDVCDVHLLSSFDTPTSSTKRSVIDFNEFVQICLNVFYNLVESSSMKVLETPLRSRSDPVRRRFTDDGLDTTAEERLQRRLSTGTEIGDTGFASPSTPRGHLRGSDPLDSLFSGRGGDSTPLPEDFIHRKSFMEQAEVEADAAADAAREEMDAEHDEPPPTLAGLIQDFGLRLFFLGGVRFALALVFLAANGSLIMVLVNRFNYTVEVALGFALVFDLGVALFCMYLASRLKKMEQNLAMLTEADDGEGLGDLPEEIDSLVPGLGKLLPSGLGFLSGMQRGGKKPPKTPKKSRTIKKNNREKKESFISRLSNFFGGGKKGASGPGSAHQKSRSMSFTELDYTPYKGTLTKQGKHSRQPSAELLICLTPSSGANLKISKDRALAWPERMALVGRLLARAGPRCASSGSSALTLSSFGHLAGFRRDFGSGDTSGSDEIEEFLDYHLSKQSDAPGTFRQSVATTRRESLSLYRDILRFSRFFTWPDANGRPFRESIRESARKEYEAARFEKDPQIINKLIVSGRDCLEKSLQNVIDKQRQIVEDQMKSGPPDNGI